MRIIVCACVPSYAHGLHSNRAQIGPVSWPEAFIILQNKSFSINVPKRTVYRQMNGKGREEGKHQREVSHWIFCSSIFFHIVLCWCCRCCRRNTHGMHDTHYTIERVLKDKLLFFFHCNSDTRLLHCVGMAMAVCVCMCVTESVFIGLDFILYILFLPVIFKNLPSFHSANSPFRHCLSISVYLGLVRILYTFSIPYTYLSHNIFPCLCCMKCFMIKSVDPYRIYTYIKVVSIILLFALNE